MTCLQNPSLFCRFPPLLLFDKLPRFYNFWKWSALILALLVTLTGFIRRIMLFMHQIPVKPIGSCQKSCSQQIYNDDDSDFEVSDHDDDDDDTSSSVTDSQDESDNFHKPAVEVFRAEGCSYRRNDRGQEGNCRHRRRNGFLWSEVSAGESVVKLWDSLGVGLDVKYGGSDQYESDVTIWEQGKDANVSSGDWLRNVVAAGNVVVTTDINDIDIDADGVYGDTKTPAIYAAWQPGQRKACVKDNDDVVSVTESDWETWWEGDRRFGYDGVRSARI